MKRLRVVQGDITTLKVDVIVNAANPTLLGGGGVDGAIHKAAGPQLLNECKTLGGCLTGEAKMTSGYALPAQYVIHAVGPVWKGGAQGEAKALESCYLKSLKLASKNYLKTIAFPLISTGAYAYPIDQACQVAVQAIQAYLMAHDEINEVLLVAFDGKAYQICQKAVGN